MGNNCCAHGDGDNVQSIAADGPRAEEQAANEAETVADAYGVGAASHDEVYAAEHLPQAAAPPPSQPQQASLAPLNEDAPQQLSFTLERKAEDSIGLNLDAVDEMAPFVDDVLAGSIMDWNRGRAPEQQLNIYDRIVEVNDVRGNTNSILAAMKGSATWKLVIQRPMKMQVTVHAEKAISLGLDLKYSPNGRSLLIDEVLSDGGIKRWNEENPKMQVKALDRVIQINGKVGTAKDLLDSAANQNSLELVILRYT